MKKIKLVFQGDSITDGGRDVRDLHTMGESYPKYASAQLREELSQIDFEFINQGIGGNRTDQLFDRLYLDAIAFDPDVISVLIGINDIWARISSRRIGTTYEQIEANFRAIMQSLRQNTHAKIVVMTPYLLDCTDKESVRADLPQLQEIVRRLAAEYADLLIPLDELFEVALKTQPHPLYYSPDGVHPNANGAAFIGKCYADAVKPLLESM